MNLNNFGNFFNQLGLMALPLFICAVVSLAIIIERLVFFVKISKNKNLEFEKLLAILNQHQNYAKNLRDEIISISLKELKIIYNKGLKSLNLISAISPMIGLLGTILGIISSFRAIANSTSAVSPSLIADGLSEAMLTTAFGLFIALPALLFANFFKILSDKILEKLCFKLNKISILMEAKND